MSNGHESMIDGAPFVENAREMATMALAFIQGAYSMIEPANPKMVYPAIMALSQELNAARRAHPYGDHPVYFALIAALRGQMPAMPAVKSAPQGWFHFLRVTLHDMLFSYLEKLIFEHMEANQLPCYDVALHEIDAVSPYAQTWAVFVVTSSGTREGRIGRIHRAETRFELTMFAEQDGGEQA